MSASPTEIPHQLVRQASLSGEIDALVSMFAEDAIFMPPNDTTVYGKEEIRAWWEEYFTFFRITSSVETENDITVAGNQAFIRSSFSVTIVPKQQGPRILDDIRNLTVWNQQPDGSWKITHQIWNSTKPVGSGTNRYMTRMLQKKGARSS
jgi:ketosteroid isomerase-like protein